MLLQINSLTSASPSFAIKQPKGNWLHSPYPEKRHTESCFCRPQTNMLLSMGPPPHTRLPAKAAIPATHSLWASYMDTFRGCWVYRYIRGKIRDGRVVLFRMRLQYRLYVACGQVIWIPSEATGCTGTS
jgi:hypothetical protein